MFAYGCAGKVKSVKKIGASNNGLGVVFSTTKNSTLLSYSIMLNYQTKLEKKLELVLKPDSWNPDDGCLGLSSIHLVKSSLGMTPELQGTRGLILWSGRTNARICMVSILKKYD